ncbi:MAG: hypothetical protein D6738_06065 [Acidobacteria bacterium]|nr:MAG: hypothetical protein D6738_06065 [Acidobacteriota bacterium]
MSRGLSMYATIRALAVVWLFAAAAGGLPCPAAGATVRGIVFVDADADGQRDAGERGLAGVGVSDGETIVETGPDGRFALPAAHDALVFAIVPRGFAAPVDARGVPRFWTEVVPGPGEVALPLVPADAGGRFDVLLVADPQVRDRTDVDYFRRDIVEPLHGTSAAFALALGDIVYDAPDLYPELTALTSRLGMPFMFVPGNHDVDREAHDDRTSDRTWRRTFGPATRAFDRGAAHFLLIDDVIYPAPEGPSDYVGGLREDQWRFVEADLARVSRDRLVVVALHIPLADMREADRLRLFRLLAPFARRLVVAGHWHIQRQYFWSREDGFPSDEPLHEFVAPTASGSWWLGEPDEFGIPHATMRDGAPNGVTRLEIDGTAYRLRFVPARRPEGDQFHVALPGRVRARRLAAHEVLVNVYAGSERTRVTMRVDGGAPVALTRTEGRIDPLYAALVEREAPRAPRRHRMPRPIPCPHLWRGTLPAGLAAGPHVLGISVTDMFGRTDRKSVIVVVEP